MYRLSSKRVCPACPAGLFLWGRRKNNPWQPGKHQRTW